MIKKKPTYISLFSSAGVGCYGFLQENFECIATNEIIDRRLNIQKINNKCKYDSAYINGDIENPRTKELIYKEIKKWSNLGNDRVDVVIATPPCQGMSVFNHKKNKNDIKRNSLIVESVEMIKKIRPRFFIFENVSSFWKTGCVDTNNDIVPIGTMITNELSSSYTIHHQIINFKNYGSNSSRTRTLVIGVDKELSDDITPIELMPDYSGEKKLFEVIGKLPKLEWGQYAPNDFFHSFRTYPEHMRDWISNLKQGMGAFEQKDDHLKPHKVINNHIVVHKNKSGDKYTRQVYNNVAPCIHTRNDQLASQNTIHPIEDRVFTIRELMMLMAIPSAFKWINLSLNELNALSLTEKKDFSKTHEMNIRQSIGEAVPTIIFQQIAKKIQRKLSKNILKKKEILELISKHELQSFENLKKFIEKNRNSLNLSSLSKIIELANAKRLDTSAYYTNKSILNEIFYTLPSFDKEEITIIEPSVGSGNFIPFIIKKYEHIKKVNLIVIDIDGQSIDLVKLLYHNRFPENFHVTYICNDFMLYDTEKADLVIGNPPFTKLLGNKRNLLLAQNYNKKSTNLAEFILEKSLKIADYVSLIMPKNILNTPEYEQTRDLLETLNIKSILDFGEKGFDGVLVETINITIDTNNKSSSTLIKSVTENITIQQKSNYIFNKSLPYWVIYRNDFFDEIFNKLDFNIFTVFRDRQITNNNSSLQKKNESDIRIIKSRNINDSGEKIINIDNYDSYINKVDLSNLTVKKFLNDENIYMTPNMTYKPRVMQKAAGYVVNGSIALLIPKKKLQLTKKQMKYFSSDEFRKFYKIARNFQTRSLNIDATSCFWFGINRDL